MDRLQARSKYLQILDYAVTVQSIPIRTVAVYGLLMYFYESEVPASINSDMIAYLSASCHSTGG